MQPDPARCSECGGETEIGFIIDCSENVILQQTWAKDRPQKRKWLPAIKVKRDTSHTVDAYRCKSCDFLKSYAR